MNSARGRNFRHYFGVQSGITSRKYDHIFDAPSPPSAPDVTSSLSFLRSLEDGRQQKLMTDFSSMENGGETWQVKLSGLEQNIVYNAVINGVETLSEALNVTVVDRKRGIKLDMKKSAVVSVTVANNETEKNLEILVGSAAYIAEQTRNLKELPAKYELAQNYPNPFNPATIINYAVPELAKGRENVSLSIYDARGRIVRTLVSEKKESGYYSVHWDGMNNKNVSVSAGVYMYRIKIGSNYVKTMKMVLTK
jgi:flagellar hook assembly protein FlgD